MPSANGLQERINAYFQQHGFVPLSPEFFPTHFKEPTMVVGYSDSEYLNSKDESRPITQVRFTYGPDDEGVVGSVQNWLNRVELYDAFNLLLDLLEGKQAIKLITSTKEDNAFTRKYALVPIKK